MGVRYARNTCTTSAEITVRMRPFCVYDVRRYSCSFSPVLHNLDQLAPAFERAGFFHRPGNPTRDHRPPSTQGSDQDWAKLFFSPGPGKRATNVHVRVEGRANQRYALLFRDYLRAHPVAAAAYAELKRRLAALGIDSGTYADVKDPACDLIMAAAEDWCVQTGWTAGPTDV